MTRHHDLLFMILTLDTCKGIAQYISCYFQTKGFELFFKIVADQLFMSGKAWKKAEILQVLCD